jgi:hypothetical protein
VFVLVTHSEGLGIDGKMILKWILGKLGAKMWDNIRVYLREVGWEGVDWMHLTQWRVLVNTVITFRFQSTWETS